MRPHHTSISAVPFKRVGRQLQPYSSTAPSLCLWSRRFQVHPCDATNKNNRGDQVPQESQLWPSEATVPGAQHHSQLFGEQHCTCSETLIKLLLRWPAGTFVSALNLEPQKCRESRKTKTALF